jgi:hypothetical protein
LALVKDAISILPPSAAVWVWKPSQSFFASPSSIEMTWLRSLPYGVPARLTNAAIGRNQVNRAILNRREQREQSAPAFSVVSVISCSKMRAGK